MSHSLKSILECVVRTGPTKSAMAGSDKAIDMLEAFDDVYLYCETQCDSYDLMLVCGELRFIVDPFKSDTIIMDGLRTKVNRLDFTLISKMKSLGYQTLTFNNDDIAVYTKNSEIAAALRRPLQPKPTKTSTSVFNFNTKPVGDTDEG